MTSLRILVAGCSVAMACGLPGHAGGAVRPARTAAAPRSVTVPFSLDHNRMIVDVEFTRPDGTLRRARAWVDMGSEAFVLAETLARDLGLDLSAMDAGPVGHLVAIGSAAPSTRIAGLPLDVAGIGVQVRSGTSVPAGAAVEVQLPASALRHDHIVLDYPARRLTVARPGVLKSRGEAIPCRVNAVTGLLMIAANLDGEGVWLGVDNGSAGTWVSDSLTRTWQARHPSWPRAIGAAGSTNFFGFPFETRGVLMRLPAIGLGALRARDVAVLGMPQSLFDWYSKKSAGPVLGFLGANVLREFRLEIDYPSQMTYWLPAPPMRSRDLDIVGLTLRPEPDGSTTVVGVVTRASRPVVEGVQPGDRLVGVDGRNLATAGMGVIVDALRGEPGTVRVLVLERAGKRLTVRAPVTRLP